MFVNRPSAPRPMPNFLLAPNRPMGGTPAPYMAAPPPNTSTLLNSSRAGEDVMANLASLGTNVWNFLREMFAKVRSTVMSYVN